MHSRFYDTEMDSVSPTVAYLMPKETFRAHRCSGIVPVAPLPTDPIRHLPLRMVKAPTQYMYRCTRTRAVDKNLLQDNAVKMFPSTFCAMLSAPLRNPFRSERIS